MKNFTKNVIPMQQIGFALQVPFIPSEDDSVRLLFEVTEGLDFTDLYKTYSTLRSVKLYEHCSSQPKEIQ